MNGTDCGGRTALSTSVRCLVVGGSLLLASRAGAQDTPVPATGSTAADSAAAAQALFVEGRGLVREGRYAEGCEKLEQSRHLDPAPGTVINLADCYEKLGKVASAWLAFHEAAATAQRYGRAEWAEKARERASALEPNVPHLTVAVDEPAPGTTVRRAGVLVEESALGSPVPVNPGAYVIDAVAPGRRPWSTRLVVEAATRVVLHVPRLAEETSNALTPAPVVPCAPAPVTGSLQRTIALGLAAVAVVPIGIGSYFGVRAISRNDSAGALCPTSACTDPTAISLTSQAHQNAVASNVSFIAGGVLLAAAAALFFTAPARVEHPSVAVGVDGTTGAIRASW